MREASSEARALPRKPLKLLHELGAIGVMGSFASRLVSAANQTRDDPVGSPVQVAAIFHTALTPLRVILPHGHHLPCIDVGLVPVNDRPGRRDRPDAGGRMNLTYVFSGLLALLLFAYLLYALIKAERF
jgi:K+-transporting ATPase KdpF subunit